ncbi:hypothetical protein BKA93DRAFT_749316 [Sparassis latifolia]
MYWSAAMMLHDGFRDWSTVIALCKLSTVGIGEGFDAVNSSEGRDRWRAVCASLAVRLSPMQEKGRQISAFKYPQSYQRCPGADLYVVLGISTPLPPGGGGNQLAPNRGLLPVLCVTVWLTILRPSRHLFLIMDVWLEMKTEDGRRRPCRMVNVNCQPTSRKEHTHCALPRRRPTERPELPVSGRQAACCSTLVDGLRSPCGCRQEETDSPEDTMWPHVSCDAVSVGAGGAG